jgi:zeaxanthin glucosyltransferase
MATIGVLVPPSPGHLNPMTSLGRELARRGHRVVVAVLPDAEAAVLASGLEVAPIGAEEYPPGSLPEIHAQLGRLRGWVALKYTLDVMTRAAGVLFRDVPGAFRSVGADLLLVDQASPGGTSVAEHLGLPSVTVANALMFNVDPDVPPPSTTWPPTRSAWGRVRNHLAFQVFRRAAGPMIGAVAGQRRAWGLPPHPDPRDWFSPLAEVGQEPAEFEFPRRSLPPHFHFTGPFQDPRARAPVPFPFEALDGRPLIYASMGTLQNRLLWIFRAIAEACDGLGVQLVISLGGSADPGVLGSLPGSPLVVRAAPQLELLDRARLTITHAGMNTTLESLARGVPMVAIPIANDQPGVAARIAWTGTGLFIPPSRLTARKLRAAVARVLSEPSFAGRAARMREAIDRAGGAARAADVIERVLETGRPVLAEGSEAERPVTADPSGRISP